MNFDVAQGSWDGAEVTDLVGFYLLAQLQHLEEFNCGLYRDDMLAATELHGKEAEQLKQKISSVFQAEGLTVKVEVNKKVVDFLNVTLSLQYGTHCDFMKPGQVLSYVHSNHPPVVTKGIADGIAYRLSVNSSNEAKQPYEEWAHQHPRIQTRGGWRVGAKEEEEENKHNLVQPSLVQ